MSALSPKDHPSITTRVRFWLRSAVTRSQVRDSVNMLCHRTATAARWLRRAYERSAAIQRVLDDAAVTTPEACPVQAQMEQRRHDEFANACRLALGGLPPGALVDEVWALGSRAMWFKLAERGWSPEDWEAWFVRVVLDAIRSRV
jgi:hypothetical protein